MRPIVRYWMTVFPVAWASVMVSLLVSVSVACAQGCEDVLVGFLFLFGVMGAIAVSSVVSLLLSSFGRIGLILIVIGVVPTLVSGLFLSSFVERTYSSTWGYGLPIPWWEITNGPDFQRPRMDYDAFSFILDMLSYAVIGYLLVLSYDRFRRRQKHRLSIVTI